MERSDTSPQVDTRSLPCFSSTTTRNAVGAIPDRMAIEDVWDDYPLLDQAMNSLWCGTRELVRQRVEVRIPTIAIMLLILCVDIQWWFRDKLVGHQLVLFPVSKLSTWVV